MKLAELRSIIDKYSADQMKYLIGEMYRALPKSLKDDDGFDKIIRNPDLPGKNQRKVKQFEAPDMGLLEDEITEFIQNAYNQYYLIPNRVVSKAERSKWRFSVKRFYKDLIAAAGTQENTPLTAKLLEKIYDVLCYSCSFTIFSSYDAFESVGIPQPDFFRQVLLLKHELVDRKTFIEEAFLLMINTRLNRYTLHSHLMYVVLEFLKTPELREMAISDCSVLMEAIKMGPHPKKERSYSQDENEERINLLAEMGFLCYAQLYEYENAVLYFKQHYLHNSPEVKLYILLELLFSIDQKEWFLREYENAKKTGIEPRDSLKRTYQFVKTNNKFPEYIR